MIYVPLIYFMNEDNDTHYITNSLMKNFSFLFDTLSLHMNIGRIGHPQ